VPELRQLSGRDEAVIDYLDTHTVVLELFTDIKRFLERWLPAFQAQDRAYITVAVGCTGGQHRSVYLVEKLAPVFRERYEQVVVRHRELGL
jgi:RNase adapter protein RapZ